MFSNAVSHSLVIRRVSVAGIGSDAGFKPDEKEYRFTCRFDPLQPGGGKTIQRGTMNCPGGETLRFVVNDEKGASSPDGAFRVFAGLRSDPFFLAWIVEKPRTLREFAAARQCAGHRDRIRYRTGAQSQPGSIVWSDRGNHADTRSSGPHRTRTATLRLGGPPGTDQHAPEQQCDGRRGRSA